MEEKWHSSTETNINIMAVKHCPGIRTFTAVLNQLKLGANTARRVFLEFFVINISMNRVMMALACAQLSVLSKTLNSSRYWARHCHFTTVKQFKNGNPSLFLWPSAACSRESDVQTNDFCTETTSGKFKFKLPR